MFFSKNLNVWPRLKISGIRNWLDHTFMQSKKKSVAQIFRKLRKCKFLLPIPQNLSHRAIAYQRLRISWRHVSCSKLLPVFYPPFCYILSAPGLNTYLKAVWTYHYVCQDDLTHFKGCFCFFLRVTCVVFAHATNTDVFQGIVARAITCREHCTTLTIILTAFHAG